MNLEGGEASQGSPPLYQTLVMHNYVNFRRSSNRRWLNEKYPELGNYHSFNIPANIIIDLSHGQNENTNSIILLIRQI